MIARYTLPEMGDLWTDEAKFRTWLKVEVEAARAMAQAGIIPRDAFREIEAKADFDLTRINEIEEEVRHDVIAFLTAVAEQVGDAAKWLHFGMTSSDVGDTALCLQIKSATTLLRKELTRLRKAVRKLAHKHKMTPCIGRTHGVVAEPTTAGLKFAVWYADLTRRQHDLDDAAERIAVGAISGAVGNYANLPPKIEAAVCRKLGLKPATISTQVIQRDLHAELITSLATLGATIEKIATEIRNLQRTEIGELREEFSSGQKGSSAMPHKRNPITAERLTGCARLLRGYAVPALENVALWHERDIAHSSVERVILPDATILAHYAIVTLVQLINRLVINKDRMLQNVYYGGGLVFSQRLLLKLAPAVGSREDAYRLVQRNALSAADGRGDFRALVLADTDIGAHLSAEEIEECFTLDRYQEHVETIFERVFAE